MMLRQNSDTKAGYVLVTVAALLFVLVGFTALAVDTGLLYGARTQAQRAADAAALAGALTFILEPSAAQPATAENEARQTAYLNKVMGNAIAAGDVTVDFPGGIATRRVRVVIQRSEPTFFAKILSPSNVDIRVTAVAEAGQEPSEGPIKPWFVPNTVIPPAGPPPPNPMCAACASGNVLLQKTVPGCTSNCEWEPTSFAAGKYGQSFVVKPGNPQNGLAPSQFFAIRMPGDTGGSDYQNQIACIPSASNPCKNAVCQNSYEVLTGNKQGPTRSGTETLIGTPNQDTWVAVNQYYHPADMTTRSTSRSLVIAPIWDDCGYPGFCPSETFPSGSGTFVPMIGFATLFIDSVTPSGPDQGDVSAHLVNVSGCGGTPTGDTSASTVLAYPIRLVRYP